MSTIVRCHGDRLLGEACTVLDAAFPEWIKSQLASGTHQPGRICFQITESIFEQYMNAATTQLTEMTAPIACSEEMVPTTSPGACTMIG